MRFVVNGKDQDLEIISLTEITPEDMPQRKKEDGEAKTVNGKNTYSVRGAEILQDNRKTRDTYISLFAPQKIERFKPYRLEGEVIVNVYGTKTGAITTITAEKLVPVEEKPSQSNTPFTPKSN